MGNARGWTLLETMICLALTATVAWAAVPHSQLSQLRTDARLLSEVLRAIRHRAISERLDFIVSYQSGICSVSPPQAGLVGLCKRIQASRPSTITFHSNGVTSPTTLLLTDGGGMLCSVSISLRGRIRVACGELGASR